MDLIQIWEKSLCLFKKIIMGNRIQKIQTFVKQIYPTTAAGKNCIFSISLYFSAKPPQCLKFSLNDDLFYVFPSSVHLLVKTGGMETGAITEICEMLSRYVLLYLYDYGFSYFPSLYPIGQLHNNYNWKGLSRLLLLLLYYISPTAGDKNKSVQFFILFYFWI